MKQAYFSFVLFWKFFISTSNVSILVKVVVLIHFSLQRPEKRSSIHCYLYFSFYHLLMFREVSDKKLSHKSVKTLSTWYFHISLYIFIPFHFLTCDFTSYMQF